MNKHKPAWLVSSISRKQAKYRFEIRCLESELHPLLSGTTSIFGVSRDAAKLCKLLQQLYGNYLIGLGCKEDLHIQLVVEEENVFEVWEDYYQSIQSLKQKFSMRYPSQTQQQVAVKMRSLYHRLYLLLTSYLEQDTNHSEVCGPSETFKHLFTSNTPSEWLCQLVQFANQQDGMHLNLDFSHFRLAI
jgi:hypothetical protein